MARLIGLTGGIASGKSTVSSYLKKRGYAVLDADQLVHDLQAVGGRLYQVLVEYFGKEILQEDQTLDRAKLGQLIFSDPEQLALSSRLQDQIIREELEKAVADLSLTADLIFLDIPLLFEKDYADWCQEIWLVFVSENIQLERLMVRNDLTQEDAKKRLAAQLPLAEKLAKSQVVINNEGSLRATFTQVDQALKKLER